MMTKKMIIKIGGSTTTQLTPAFFDTLKHWQKLGYQIAIVHGGGNIISDLMSQLNEPVEKINGIRFTTQKGIDITKMALLGQVQPSLIESFRQNGVPAIGLNAGSNQLLTGHVLDQDTYGYVGTIHQVNTQLIQKMWQQNLIPIIAPLAITNEGQWLNVNADTAASAIAKYLKADKLYLLTDVSGIKVSGNILQQLTPKMALELKKSHIITGGMIPKVNSALHAVQLGVHHVHITDTVTQPGTVVTL
ncbi:N-acetylglutamate 5-phosphotransferase (acetylglutamate kinase) [Leuconostoc carnosum]|nr:acetylglutamate kinase [Leuconostoc carnosum]SPJ43632.1 N-acetylglutamate 5-phosphotransferase (acetylglutamate kinase) [Leuconostoc carnosum]SPO33900.1 N-acetylglutamate 5-phosphotransferase (acetylglutamate kinase) [Leuconostoc carnosum]